MEPTPPPRRRERPFYDLPDNVPASANIIKEARTSLRTVFTRRPFTPREDKRTLFPASTSRAPESRPPSAFSLNSRHFDGADSRPVSGTRLMPLEHTPRAPTAAEVESLLPPRPPPSDSSRPHSGSRRGSRPKLQHAVSVDQGAVSPEDSAYITDRSSSLTDVSGIDSSGDVGRRLGSGGTREERGMGDGQESSNRASSGGRERDRGDQRVSSGGSRKSSAGKSGSRTGSAGRRESEDGNDISELYSQKIQPLVEEMALAGKSRDAERARLLARDLYSLLEEQQLLGRACKFRSAILKVIFKLMDMEDPHFQVALARLILALKVTGINLLSVCKLIFKISRNKENDNYFLEDNIIELLIEAVQGADPGTGLDMLVFALGAMKFLSGNPAILTKLVRCNTIEILAKHMETINRLNREHCNVNEQFGHGLVQLAGTLRNLLDVKSARERMINCRVIENYCQLLDSYPGDFDLVTFIVRFLSRATPHTDCCLVLANQPLAYKSFITLLKRYVHKEDLVVRLCFVMGNLTAKNDDARVRLFQEAGAMETLTEVLRTYKDTEAQCQGSGNHHPAPAEEDGDVEEDKGQEMTVYEDVLIKVIRVLANLSINETVGPVIASNADCLKLLLDVMESKDLTTHEELVLNTVATINNLSYYSGKSSAISTHQLRVAKALMRLVLVDHKEGMIEVSRVFGNLTRQRPVRDYLSENKVDEVMVTLLDSGSRELVYIACGVLVNFMTDEEKRPLLKREGGVRKLLEVLRDFGREDWQLSGTVCKVLCNYSTKITSASDCFGEPEAQELGDLLAEYLDKETILEAMRSDQLSPDVQEYMLETWEVDFQPVAMQLLQRIETHMSSFEPLEAPS